jgi:hypothetical protein
MKMALNGVMAWFCNQFGHNWRIREESAPPERCAKCRSRLWRRDRNDDAQSWLQG